MSEYLGESEGHPYRGNYCERMALPLDTLTTPGASLSDGVTEPRGKVLPLNSRDWHGHSQYLRLRQATSYVS